MKYLKRHPFPTVAFFKRVVAVSFAFPEETLRSLAPGALEVDTFQGLGFITVAMVWTHKMRPAGFPAFSGRDFFLAGYRLFARLHDPTGRRLRGLKILRSETDQRQMVWLGNLFTHYNYRRVSVRIEEQGGVTRVETTLPSGRPTMDITFREPSDSVKLPPDSPFPDWKTARRFAGPMPFTFSPEDDESFVVIEGTRQEWSPRPIEVEKWQVGIFDEPPFKGVTPVLANAFTVEGIPYRWSKGRIIRPGGPA